MTLVAELVFGVKTEGTEEASRDAATVSKNMQKSGESAQKGGKGLAEYAGKVAGSMAVITATMGAAISGLMIQVPIIQELVSALSVVVVSLAMVIDGVLRPVLLPLVDGLLWIAEAFDKLPGPIKTFLSWTILLVGIVLILSPLIIGLVIAIAAVGIAVVIAAAIIAALAGTIVVLVGNIVLWGTVFNALAPIVLGVAKKILAGWSEIPKVLIRDFTNLLDYLAGLWERIRGVVGEKLSNILTDIGKIITPIAQVFYDIQDKIETIWDSLWSGLVSVVTTNIQLIRNVINGIVDIVRGVINTLITSINTVIAALNGISVTIPDWVPVVGGNSWSLDVPKIPALASGGVVQRPTMALIGESGPEAVIPLNELGQMMASLGQRDGNPIYIQIDGRTIMAALQKHPGNRLNTLGVRGNG